MADFRIKNSIPLLPAVDLKATIAFYKDLGFKNIYGDKERSGGYAVMDNQHFIFHLYTFKQLPVPTPTNMHLIEVEHIDDLYNLLMTNYKAVHGKVPPRNGLPRVGIPKNLNSDRRFSLTDPNGNQFIFVEGYEKVDHHIQSRFEKLYWESNTLAYSHESPFEAIRMMESGLKRVGNLEDESANIVFQALVLLMDCHVLLDDKVVTKQYFDQTTDWFNKIDDNGDQYLVDAIKQFNEYKKMIR